MSLAIRMPFSFGYREASPVSILQPVSGEKGGRKVRETCLLLSFSQTPSAETIQYANGLYLGVVSTHILVS